MMTSTMKKMMIMNEEERARKREKDRKYRQKHPGRYVAVMVKSYVRKLKKDHPKDYKRLMRDLRYDLRKVEAEEMFNQARGLGECYG